MVLVLTCPRTTGAGVRGKFEGLDLDIRSGTKYGVYVANHVLLIGGSASSIFRGKWLKIHHGLASIIHSLPPAPTKQTNPKPYEANRKPRPRGSRSAAAVAWKARAASSQLSLVFGLGSWLFGGYSDVHYIGVVAPPVPEPVSAWHLHLSLLRCSILVRRFIMATGQTCNHGYKLLAKSVAHPSRQEPETWSYG